MTSDNKEEKDYYGVAPINSIVKKMKKEYDKDPKDWRVIGSNDDKGNLDTFITKKPNAYWLKSKQLSPYSALSMGTVIRNLDKDIDERIGKKMSSNDMFRLFGMIVPIKRDQNVIATGIEKYSQEHGNYLKKLINERDPNIGQVLGRRIDKEFSKRHPQRRGLYL
ncbi:MAG: hypothetical protein KAW51_09615 [Candidatus Lokiarchaeota archaeon]|nr:hypothetical protein [Candidatus Lokiarchaeota archaeon]